MNLIRSLTLTVFVSTLIAAILHFSAGYSFIASFLTSTVIQFVLFFTIGSVLDFFNEIKMKQINTMRLAELSKQSMEVECPCHKKNREIVPIVLNTKNTYKCTACNKTNSVYIVAETAHVTETDI